VATATSLNDGFPTSGRIAAVDYGTKRIGIAICDPDWILASPLGVYDVRDAKRDGLYFAELSKLERIDAFVVGLPIHCDGGESQKSTESRAFARWLREVTGCPVRLFDERFTTSAARQRMNVSGSFKRSNKRPVDAIAALVLLESFLEASRYRDEIVGESIDGPILSADSLDDAD
jgi:putative holliday junction resolvase